MADTSLVLSAGDYILYSVLGICVVFFALILLIGIIKLMWLAPSAKGATEAPAMSADETDPGDAGALPLAPGTAGDVKLHGTDPRDAAMVMAIVADELKKPLNELRFISIKEVKR